MLRTKQRLRRHDAVRKEKRFSLKTKWRKNTGNVNLSVSCFMRWGCRFGS
ncbi:hypothetical protein F2Q69_00004825 [Brassica cretica]|uniref:Uncharacterized protein n=1 Tax=Brassica cretica TaxID=69181 RepID=A0A8S9P7W9_BRACR|nr:hypothetical protein F2Q69_00004825 [Brassica cretica]